MPQPAKDSILTAPATKFACLLLPILCTFNSTHSLADPGKSLTPEPYPWLRAVGTLQIPSSQIEKGRRRHHKEDCSATLIALAGARTADTIITAWHCLERYNDLSKPITFTLHDAQGTPLEREAYHLADGGGMHADWAVLRLHQAITTVQVAALTVHPAQADIGDAIIMAGYSRHRDSEGATRELHFDNQCAITGADALANGTDCRAAKGASGGPVIQLTQAGVPQVCGVISQGDGEGYSTFIAVSSFRDTVNAYLQ